MSLVMKADLGTVAYLIPATDKRPEIAGYLGTFDKHLLLVLADRGNADGRSIWPSVEWMAKSMGATERAVRISLLRLKGTFPQILVVEQGQVSRYSTLHYRIMVSALERAPQWKLRKDDPGMNDVHPSGVLRGERSSSRGERHSLRTELSSAEPSVEPSVEPPVDQKHPAPRNGAAKSAQAVQQDGLLPDVAVVVDALEVPTPGSAARPAGGTHTAAAPDRPGRLAVALYCEAFKARYGRNPIISGKDAGTLARLAKVIGADYETCLARYFADGDPYLVKHGHSTGLFENRLNALRVNGNGSRPASISEKWAGAKPGVVEL